MILLLFWVRIIFKRIAEFIKTSPVITAGAAVLLSAVIYTNTNIQLTLDFSKFIIACSVLATVPLVMGLKEFDVSGKMLFYAKSNYSNRLLRYIFFLKKSLSNNIFMVLFLVLVLSKRIIFDFSSAPRQVLFIFPLSVFLSFMAVVLRNNGRTIAGKGNKIRGGSTGAGRSPGKIRIGPVIKSTLYDYTDSALTAVVITVLSLFICAELFKDLGLLSRMEEPVLVPLTLLVLSSTGFTGLSDSAANTNWPFYAVISLDFAYHFRRMLVFLSSFYGIVLLQYTIIVTHINILLSLPYLFSVVSIMLFTIGIACSKGSTIKKTALCGLYILPAVRILYSNPYIMAAGILPPVIVLLAAKHNFAEWGYL